MSRNFPVTIYVGSTKDDRQEQIKKRYGNEIFYVEKKSTYYGVEEIRDLRKTVNLRVVGRQKLVMVFCDAQFVSEIAQNMLLNMLESENIGCIFVFESDSEEVFLPTVRSRAQVIRLADTQNENTKENMVVSNDLNLESIVQFSETVTEKAEMQKIVRNILSWMRDELKREPSGAARESLREMNDLVNEIIPTNVQPRLATEVMLLVLYKYRMAHKV